MPKQMLLSAVWYMCRADLHTHISHKKKLPEFNFCTLTVYMYIPVAAHVHFPVNLHKEKFPSGDEAEVFLCIQQDVNGLGSAIK